MKTHVRVAAAALLLAGVAAGCTQTTEGEVAMTTEPGPRTTSSRSTPTALPTIPGLPDFQFPDIQIPGLPGLPGSSDVPDVPPPPNALTMKCDEYTKLDEAEQKAVIKAILKDEGRTDQSSEMTAQILASAMCSFMPDLTVSEVVSGSPP